MKILAIVALLATVLVTGCGVVGGYGPMHGPGAGWPGMFGGYMWIIILAVAAVVIWLVFRGGRSGSGGRFEESPLDILKRRYAAGEITREQFEQMKRTLDG